jgi:hypothetical protein
MTISGQAGGSLLDSILNTETVRNDISVALLKKAQDVEKQQGAAVIKMLEQSAIPPQGLDAYA